MLGTKRLVAIYEEKLMIKITVRENVRRRVKRSVEEKRVGEFGSRL